MKKIRKIIVNDIVYYWKVSNYNCDGDGNCSLKIYKNKKVIYEELMNINVTPSYIKNIIIGAII